MTEEVAVAGRKAWGRYAIFKSVTGRVLVEVLGPAGRSQIEDEDRWLCRVEKGNQCYRAGDLLNLRTSLLASPQPRRRGQGRRQRPGPREPRSVVKVKGEV
jgi:hypothetical protein